MRLSGKPMPRRERRIGSFTGQTQDTLPGAQGTYDFLFRQQSSSQGRWLVPDPAGVAAVDPTNPQTWNRYAYVGNNPLSNMDPLGLDGQCDDKGNCTVTGSAPAPGGWWDLAYEGWPGQGSMSSFFCMLFGGCSSNGSSSGGGGGGTSQPQPKPQPQPAKPPAKRNCVQPNGLQALEASALRKLATFTGKTVGFGVGAGGGFGLVGIGVSASGSAQMMADPSGTAALVYSWTLPSAGYMSTAPGQGENMGAAANIGIQFTANSQPIGTTPSWSLDGSFANVGLSAGSSGGSLTVGAGFGARGTLNLNVNLPTVLTLCP